MSLFALALALTVAAPQAVPAAAAASLVDPARKARGIELARILNSEEMTLAQTDKMLSETLPTAFAAEPSFESFEKDTPGISKAMIEAMRPIMIEYMIKSLPILWERIGTIYAEELTVAELDEAIAFFRAPTGIRVIEGMTREADFSKMTQELVADEKATVTEASLHAGLATGATRTVRQLGADDQRILTNFGWTAAGAKLGATKARTLPIIAAWSNETDPETEARMEKAVLAAMDKFIGLEAEE